MPSYEAFARFYDAVQGDRSEALPFVLPHLSGARTVLELARQKLPGVELVLGDMTTIRLGRTFDTVLCLYDAVNHLLEFEDWERLFDTAAAHLRPGGVFVFDMNSRERLEWFVGRPAVALDFGDANVAVIDVADGGGRIINWELRFFEQLEGDRYRLTRETIREAAFPEPQVRAALETRFASVAVEEESGRVWFACRTRAG